MKKKGPFFFFAWTVLITLSGAAPLCRVFWTDERILMSTLIFAGSSLLQRDKGSAVCEMKTKLKTVCSWVTGRRLQARE